MKQKSLVSRTARGGRAIESPIMLTILRVRTICCRKRQRRAPHSTRAQTDHLEHAREAERFEHAKPAEGGRVERGGSVVAGFTPVGHDQLDDRDRERGYHVEEEHACEVVFRDLRKVVDVSALINDAIQRSLYAAFFWGGEERQRGQGREGRTGARSSEDEKYLNVSADEEGVNYVHDEETINEHLHHRQELKFRNVSEAGAGPQQATTLPPLVHAKTHAMPCPIPTWPMLGTTHIKRCCWENIAGIPIPVEGHGERGRDSSVQKHPHQKHSYSKSERRPRMYQARGLQSPPVRSDAEEPPLPPLHGQVRKTAKTFGLWFESSPASSRGSALRSLGGKGNFSVQVTSWNNESSFP